MKLLIQLIFGAVVFMYVLSPMLHVVETHMNKLSAVLVQAEHTVGVK